MLRSESNSSERLVKRKIVYDDRADADGLTVNDEAPHLPY